MTASNVTLKIVDPVTSPEYINLKQLEQSVAAISELSDALSGTEYHNLVTILSERLTGSFERVYVDAVRHISQ
ncbi:MAG: hypothetical protein ACRCYD_16650 [Plesiomonas sp.]